LLEGDLCVVESVERLEFHTVSEAHELHEIDIHHEDEVEDTALSLDVRALPRFELLRWDHHEQVSP